MKKLLLIFLSLLLVFTLISCDNKNNSAVINSQNNESNSEESENNKKDNEITQESEETETETEADSNFGKFTLDDLDVRLALAMNEPEIKEPFDYEFNKILDYSKFLRDDNGDLLHYHTMKINEPYIEDNTVKFDVFYIVDSKGNSDNKSERKYTNFHPDLLRRIRKITYYIQNNKDYEYDYGKWSSFRNSGYDFVYSANGHNLFDTLKEMDPDYYEEFLNDPEGLEYLEKAATIPYNEAFGETELRPIKKATIDRIFARNDWKDAPKEKIMGLIEPWTDGLEDSEYQATEKSGINNPVKKGEFYEIKNLSVISPYEIYADWKKDVEVWNETTYDLKVSIENVREYPENIDYIEKYSSGYDESKGEIKLDDNYMFKELNIISKSSTADMIPITAVLKFEFSNLKTNDNRPIHIKNIIPYYKKAIEFDGDDISEIEILGPKSDSKDRDITFYHGRLDTSDYSLEFDGDNEEELFYIKSGTDDAITYEFEVLLPTYIKDSKKYIGLVIGLDMWSYWQDNSSDIIDNYVFFEVSK